MKKLLLITAVFLSNSAFAQDTKKDTVKTGSYEDFGARIYDARIGRSMSIDPKQSKENSPYQFADTTATKQPVTEPKKKITAK